MRVAVAGKRWWGGVGAVSVTDMEEGEVRQWDGMDKGGARPGWRCLRACFRGP